jgi:hypothetical protein
MSQLSNREQLKNYCLRKLGGGVIDINVSEEQIQDRIDDAIEFFIDYGYNVTEKKYLPIKISQLDITNNYVTVPEELLSVTRILPLRNPSLNSSSYLFDMEYHITARDLLNTIGTGDVSQYYISKQHIATIQDLFTARPQHEFRRYTDKLYFKFSAEDRLSVDDYIVLECHTPIDQTSRFWNERNLRNYATALIGLQWGNNLSKFEEVILVGGTKLNGSKIADKYQKEIDKMELDPNFLYSEPVESIIS